MKQVIADDDDELGIANSLQQLMRRKRCKEKKIEKDS